MASFKHSTICCIPHCSKKRNATSTYSSDCYFSTLSGVSPSLSSTYKSVICSETYGVFSAERSLYPPHTNVCRFIPFFFLPCSQNVFSHLICLPSPPLCPIFSIFNSLSASSNLEALGFAAVFSGLTSTASERVLLLYSNILIVVLLLVVRKASLLLDVFSIYYNSRRQRQNKLWFTDVKLHSEHWGLLRLASASCFIFHIIPLKSRCICSGK